MKATPTTSRYVPIQCAIENIQLIENDLNLN
jgi:hypothetical protein